jgi:hypothetical protein
VTMNMRSPSGTELGTSVFSSLHGAMPLAIRRHSSMPTRGGGECHARTLGETVITHTTARTYAHTVDANRQLHADVLIVRQRVVKKLRVELDVSLHESVRACACATQTAVCQCALL